MNTARKTRSSVCVICAYIQSCADGLSYQFIACRYVKCDACPALFLRWHLFHCSSVPLRCVRTALLWNRISCDHWCFLGCAQPLRLKRWSTWACQARSREREIEKGRRKSGSRETGREEEGEEGLTTYMRTGVGELQLFVSYLPYICNSQLLYLIHCTYTWAPQMLLRLCNASVLMDLQYRRCHLTETRLGPWLGPLKYLDNFEFWRLTRDRVWNMSSHKVASQHSFVLPAFHGKKPKL